MTVLSIDPVPIIDPASYVGSYRGIPEDETDPRFSEPLVPLASADMSVSKTHAQFGPAPDGTIVVMDRGSTNGTVLVRQGVSRQLAPGKPAALVDGDKVVYGDREMTISREH